MWNYNTDIWSVELFCQIVIFLERERVKKKKGTGVWKKVLIHYKINQLLWHPYRWLKEGIKMRVIKASEEKKSSWLSLLYIFLSVTVYFLHNNLRTTHARSNDIVMWTLVQISCYFTQTVLLAWFFETSDFFSGVSDLLAGNTISLYCRSFSS